MASRTSVKKTYNLPPDLIERARRIFRVRTETEAIVRSLEEIAHEDDVQRMIRRTAGRLPRFRGIR